MSQTENYTQFTNPEDKFEQDAQTALGQLRNDIQDISTIASKGQLSSLQQVGETNIGSRRRQNEDYFGIESHYIQQETPEGTRSYLRGLYIVCDGMGGHSAGGVASAMAVEVLQQYFQTHWQKELPDEKTIRQGILLANEKIHEINRGKSRSGAGRMGTTLVMVMVQNAQMVVAHVGDSRAYRLNRNGKLQQLTQDHQVAQREINKGVPPQQAYQLPHAHKLTQALGPCNNSQLRPEIQYFNIKEDALLVLCSDGLSDGNLLEKYGASYLLPLFESQAHLKKGLSELIHFANQTHGHDNITAVLVKLLVKSNWENG